MLSETTGYGNRSDSCPACIHFPLARKDPSILYFNRKTGSVQIDIDRISIMPRYKPFKPLFCNAFHSVAYLKFAFDDNVFNLAFTGLFNLLDKLDDGLLADFLSILAVCGKPRP